jgi:hypothetical protein
MNKLDKMCFLITVFMKVFMKVINGYHTVIMYTLEFNEVTTNYGLTLRMSDHGVIIKVLSI